MQGKCFQFSQYYHDWKLRASSCIHAIFTIISRLLLFFNIFALTKIDWFAYYSFYVSLETKMMQIKNFTQLSQIG